MINSEEAAEDAFQLSSALTQALLDYRMKALGTVSPLLTVISGYHLKTCNAIDLRCVCVCVCVCV